MTYTDEAFRFKKSRKFGKEEMWIMKDYRNLDVDKRKEREGCRKPFADPDAVGGIAGQLVGTRYMDRTSALEAGVHGGLRRGIYSYKGSARHCCMSDGYEEFNKDKGNKTRLCGEGGRSKDGKMQVKDQEYTQGSAEYDAVWPACACYSGIQASFEVRPNNGFRYDGLYKVTACYQKWDENGYKIILFKLERLPSQLPIGTRGKFWTYPESDAPTKMPEPKKSLFPPRAKLPSFNKSSMSSYTLPSNW
ncbi:hypothetical protein ARMGADRAFT_1070435 [Armillaria gallica]|uniref:YDG domain-containing protein n=1 Tax=Armillaria gallica TaxID=47427 RepID=A0A2H3EZW7_ARMGA|nr:hypothetical protein ARMGADRAFT_1070435 [Armillaria gallica]